MKIEILTGSHPICKQHNQGVFKEINNLLLSEENPLYKKFNEEDLWLDDTDGLISIVSNSYTKGITANQFNKVKNYLLNFIKEGEFFIYIQGKCARFN
jgi:hypothetical protein